jgi:hypothetical protein
MAIQKPKDFLRALLYTQLAILPGLSRNDFFKCRNLEIVLHID